MSKLEGFDWSGLMVLGLHHLRLSPKEFWALTPYELLIIAYGSDKNNMRLGRSELDALLEQFPDI